MMFRRMSSCTPTQVVIGPAGHGVVDYGLDLADAVVRGDPSAIVIHEPDPRRLDRALATASRDSGVHLHVTDGLFGDTLEEAAERIAAAVRTRPVSMTLHDLPQPSDGERNLPRRAEAYRRMAEHATCVAVSSRHEAALFARHLDPDRPVAVVPLGTRRATAPPATAARSAGASESLTLLMAGYVYPGKGHDDVVDAAALLAARLRVPVDVVALGGIARGHETEAGQLAERAATAGVGFTVTGFVSPTEYRARIGSAAVPVVAHRHYSASRSLLDWAEAGRRPVVVPTRYTVEMADLRPGTLRLARGPRGAEGSVVGSDVVGSLAETIAGLWHDQASTWLPPGHPIGPTLDDAAESYRAWWGGLPW